MTKWNATRETVSVSWSDQTEQLHFATGGGGRTRVEILREAGESVKIP